MLAAGFTVELYGFLYFGLSIMPEIDKCIAVASVTGLAGTRIWIDCEASGADEAAGCTPASRCADVRAARNYARQAGFTTGIYSGIYYWQTEMGNSAEFASDPFWLADYFEDHRLIDTINVGGWTTVAMHQYAGSVELCGISVDEDDDITGICSHTGGDSMTPEEQAAFTALQNTVAALNTAVVKRADIMRLASGTDATGYADMLKAWNALHTAGLV